MRPALRPGVAIETMGTGELRETTNDAMRWRRFERACLPFRAGDSAGRCPAEERRPDEGVDHGVAGRAIHSPHPRGLWNRETQPRHLEKLGADATDESVKIHCVMCSCSAESKTRAIAGSPRDPPFSSGNSFIPSGSCRALDFDSRHL